MENFSSVEQTINYDIDNNHYEIVRIFAKNKDLKSLIKEIISDNKKEHLN